MKVLVQNCQTQQWLKDENDWTADSDKARVFDTSETALRYCANQGIRATQIVLKFESEQYDIAIPISDECRTK